MHCTLYSETEEMGLMCTGGYNMS